MALTFTVANVSPIINQPQVIGQLKMRVVDITCDGTATVGTTGDALTAAQLGLQEVLAFHGAPVILSNLAYVPIYDHANEKLKFYESGTASAGLDPVDGGEQIVGPFRAVVVGI